MATADQLLEMMFSWIEQREYCADQLRELARELESLRKKCNASECVGNSVSVVGAACLIGAGVATLFTGGAAAPLLGVIGATYSGVGAAISVVTKITELFSSSDTIKKAQKIEKKSNEIAEEIQDLFQKLKAERKKVSSSADPDDLDRHVMTEILGAMARRSGLKMQINVRILDKFFFDAGHDMTLNQIFFKPEVTVGLGSILTFFAFQASGKEFKPVLDKGAEQLVKQVSAAGMKTFLKGGAMVVGGAVGLAFALPDAIDNWKDQIKNNHVTEASQSLRDTANTIQKISRTLKTHFKEIKKTLQKLAEVKRCIENRNRSSEEKEKLIEFAIEMCEDETVRQWLRGNAESMAFFELVNMFNFLKQVLEKKLRYDNRENIHIIFVAHGGIEEFFIPAGALLPLSTIKDVVLYSPWNCSVDAGVAYGVATGNIQPPHRVFFCTSEEDCRISDMFHWPTNLPNRWNSMKAAGGHVIPNIIVSPVGSEEGVWKQFAFLEDTYGQPGKNRIVIPFLLPGDPGSWLRVPFFVVTLALSLVLWFSPYKATVHLAACLCKTYAGRTLNEQYLQEQYSCTVDNTGMKPSEEMLINRYTNLYRALKAVFG